jgi:hypothetical protein
MTRNPSNAAGLNEPTTLKLLHWFKLDDGGPVIITYPERGWIG